MKAFGLILLLFLLQIPGSAPPEPSRRLPNGKSRDLAILRDDYEKSRKDVAEIVRLADELEEEIEKNQEFVVSVRSLRKAEKIEKLAKRIKNRMKRVQ